MKCSGKCVCGKACSVDHEQVTKRCSCDGQHHRPHVGERWQFDNGDGLIFVAEVLEIKPKLKCKIVEIKNDKDVYWTNKYKIGRKVLPSTLTVNGPIPNPDIPRSKKLYWRYLPGQETPSE